MKELFLLDIKKIDENLVQSENTIYKTLQRYSCNIGDYENSVLAEAIFIRLGWSNKYKDTIFSFRPFFCKIVEIYSNENPPKLKDGSIIKYSFNENVLKYKINKKEKEYSYSKDKLYEKAIGKDQCLHKVLKKIKEDKEVWKKVEQLSKLSDSLSNFMPHPGYPFNQAKGCIIEVVDSLNLMIDKIQECIDTKDNLEYIENGYKKVIELEKLKIWQEWLIKNQSVYCLNGFYSVKNDNKIEGTKLFKNQSLNNPLPQNRNDILESLESIIYLLSERAERMNNAFH